jgi:hypothetical protein
MAFGNVNFDDILSTTLASYRKKLTDNVFSEKALGYWLMRKGKMEFRSGSKIVQQLIAAQNGTFMTYSGFEALNLTPQQGITAAEYPWKEAAVSVVVAGIEEAQNDGAEQLIDLVAARVQIAEATMKQSFNTMFITSDGTGNSGKNWLGLAALVGDATTSPGTVGGIDSTDSLNAFWRSKVTAAGGGTMLTTKLISAEVDGVTYDTDYPDFALTTLALYEAYEALLVAKVQYRDVDAANAGFQTLTNRGITIFWDRQVPTKFWYTLNSNHLKLVGSKSVWMKNRPFIVPEDKDGRSSLILSKGNLTTDSRRSLGVHKDLIP